MKRNLADLTAGTLDVLIVGGGIHGAAIAQEAARSGLDVGLIEQADFGHATSANSQKIMHGGLRYLQHMDFRRMRQSVRARRYWLAAAPHLVEPLKFVVPTHGRGLRSRAVMRAALALNDLVSRDRNRGVAAASAIGRGTTLTASACRALLPDIDCDDLSGAAVWFDAIAHNTERLCLGCVEAAAGHGAAVANYVHAASLMLANGAVRGVAAEDRLTGRSLEIRARLVVAACGPWSEQLLSRSSLQTERPQQDWARAMNLVVSRRLFGDFAVGLPVGRYDDRDAILNKGSRDIFFVPWGRRTIIGTFYDRHGGASRPLYARPNDIERMLAEINRCYAAARLTPEDVSFVHAGLLPMQTAGEPHGDIQLQKHTTVAAGARNGPAGLIVVVGTKYTTAMETAKQTAALLLQRLGREPRLDGGARDSGHRAEPARLAADRLRSALPRDSGIDIDCLAARYGPAAPRLAPYLATAADRQAIHAADGAGSETVLRGEIAYTVAEEMAETLADVVLRRLPLGAGGYPGHKTLMRCAEVLAEIGGWSSDRTRREIEDVAKSYEPLLDLSGTARPESGTPASS